MISAKVLRSIGRARLTDAKVLLKARRYDGSFYLCGYAVELALKARICRALQWSGFPESAREFDGLQSLRTHDLETLLRFCRAERRIKSSYIAEWSVALTWRPEWRYRAIGQVTPHDAADMVRCVERLGDHSVIPIVDLRKAMHEIARRKGDFTLFALFKRAHSLFGEWDLVISALREFVNLLAKSIGRKSLPQFAQVAIVPGNDPTVKFLLDNLPVEDGERHIQDKELFNLQIEEGIILRAQKPSSAKAARKARVPVASGSSRRR